MPIDPRKKTAKFNFGLKGLIIKENPTLLTDGGYRSCTNVEVVQEGSISSRTGKKLLGTASGLAYMIRKLIISPTENPSVPSTNPRYVAVDDGFGSNALLRTIDYTSPSFTSVAVAINTTAGQKTKAFSLVSYGAGASAAQWAFIASELKMLKDSGALASPLPTWGVPPATGVAKASVVLVGAPVSVSQVTWGYPSFDGVVITLAAPASMSDFDRITLSGITGVTITTTDGRTGINDTWDIRIGLEAADGSKINPDTLFRIYDTNGQAVLATGAAAGTMLASGFGVLGVLDGGADSSPNTTQPYDYRFCYIDSNTNNKGNPSQPMLVGSDVTDGSPVAVHLGQVLVTVWGTGRANITGIAVYRKGGTLFDAWRLVHTFTNNPGADSEVAKTFTDNTADADLVYADLLEFDNDPPVTSTLPVPIKGTLAVIAAAGWNVIAATGSIASITPGSVLHLFSDNPEGVIVEAVGGGNISAYFQRTHSAAAAYEVDAVSGQACFLAIAYQQFVLLAGDPNNPHIIYRSKGDQPEAFTQSPADGSVSTCACGTPSNPIKKLYAFRGTVLSLNLYGLFATLIQNGSFATAQKMADKGTVGTMANCNTGTEIWFLSQDGVWSWDGGSCRKRSEAIDPIFHGQAINGFVPLDYNQAGSCVMDSSSRGQVHLKYVGIDTFLHELVCEPMFNDRWRSEGVTLSGFMYAEPDTGTMVESIPGSFSTSKFLLCDQKVVSGGINYTADQFTALPGTFAAAGGNAVSFDMLLPWMDMGEPAVSRIYEEALLELDTTNSDATNALLHADLLVDFSDATADTIAIPLPLAGGRTVVSLLPQLTAVSGNVWGNSRESRAISFHIYGQAWPVQIQFFSLTLVYQDLDMLTAGGPGDWTDLGYPHDKRLYQMTVTFDVANAGNVARKIAMDTISGIDGNTPALAPQVFSLTNPVLIGGGRGKKTFPVADGTIVKMLRVRPYSTASGVGTAALALFKIFSVEFPGFEQYPPDIVSFTPIEDGGYAFPKYLNQATLEVDTAGVATTVQIIADGTVVSTQTVTATEADRHRNLTVKPSASGRNWRIYIDPSQAAIVSGGGKFQLFNPGKIFRFQQADKGEVGHTFDWDDLSHPWDKYLKSVTIEWDNTGGADVVLQLDGIGGLSGQVPIPNIAQFTLSGGRSKREFPLPKDTIAKMIRLYPTSAVPTTYRQWMKYTFDKIDYPSDVIYSTEWRDAETPTDKNPSWLSINADTNNAGCTVNLENEAGVVITITHTGTATDRMRNYPIPVDIFAKMWRLTVTPGVNTKFQLFSWGFARWQPTPEASPSLPPETVLWAPWKNAESPADKNPSWLFINADTKGVGCIVRLFNEDGLALAVLHSGTSSSRMSSYAIPADLSAKMWRLTVTLGAGAKFQLFDWGFARWQPTPQTSPDDPQEVLLFTPWNDMGWPYGSVARNLVLTIDTGGFLCPISLQNEGGTVQTFNVSTTYTSRRVVIACNAGINGLMWRLIFAPGAGGLSKLWDWSVEIVKEPPSVTSGSSLKQALGYPGYKFIRQVWLEYQSASPVVFTIESDTGTYVLNFPAHTTRQVERALLPAVFTGGLNKSKLYQFSWSSASNTKVYADMSVVEIIPQGQDQRAGATQVPLSSLMQVSI